MTDEELELCQTIEERSQPEESERRRHATSGSGSEVVVGAGSDASACAALHPAEDIQSPSKEVLIADNESRR